MDGDTTADWHGRRPVTRKGISGVVADTTVLELLVFVAENMHTCSEMGDLRGNEYLDCVHNKRFIYRLRLDGLTGLCKCMSYKRSSTT